jgi:hydroxymethylpyrimidine/phosphomethylpyrimidine kinase
MEVVLDDIGADCVKTGMLHDSEVIEAVVATLEAKAPGVPLVVDPVMVAKGGESLLAERAVATLRRRLLPRATILTPNLPEAEALAGRPVGTVAEMEEAGRALVGLGAGAVLVKGGHLAGSVLRDVLVTPDGVEVFEGRRIETPHTHGTGCTLASAIACGLAQKLLLRDAVMRARAYLAEAIRTAPGLGQGHGPVNHVHTVGSFGL